MKWTVAFSNSALKKLNQLPPNIQQRVKVLAAHIETLGPIRKERLNFGKIGKDLYHCHLKKGRPTYVAVWEVSDKKIKIVEIRYVGTHEKAPY